MCPGHTGRCASLATGASCLLKLDPRPKPLGPRHSSLQAIGCTVKKQLHSSLIPHTCMRAKSLQSCPTPWDLKDCSLPSSSVHGILQARVLKQGFPGVPEVKNPPAHAGDSCSIPDPGRSHMPRSN